MSKRIKYNISVRLYFYTLKQYVSGNFKTIRWITLIFILFCSLNSYSYEKDTTYTVYQTYNKLIKHYPQIKIVYPVTSNKIISNEDIVYKTVNTERSLHMDIYKPAKKGKYPALVMIHGGGWRSGNKSMERPMAQHIAENGFVTIAVEYRLSLEAKYPAAVHDIKAAIRFLKDNAEKYNIDTTKIAIEGESAGGHLAMLVAMTNNIESFEGDKNGSKSTSTVQAGVDVDGVLNFLAPNSLNMPRKPESADVFWLGGTFETKPLLWKEASSIYWAGKNSVPVLFICSTQPRFHAGRDEMIDILNQNGVYSESHTIPDTPHSFWLFDPWFEPTQKYIIAFLNKVFLH